MPPKAKEIYSLFVKNHSLFQSVDEILYFKQLWPLKDYVEERVKSAHPHLKMKKYHMGLDISSRSTGLCILDSDRNVLAYKAIHPNGDCKGNSILSAASIYDTIYSQMKLITEKIDPIEWNVVIEKYLQMFGTSTFRTQSLFYLAEINGIIQYKCWEELKTFPLTLHPSTARSMLNLKSVGSREETKKAVFEYVCKRTQGQIEWPQKKRSAADAYVLAQAGWIESMVDSVFAYYNVKDGLVSKSPFLTDFIKINIVHFIKKYLEDESIQDVDSLPQVLIDKYVDKLRQLVTECVQKFVQSIVCSNENDCSLGELTNKCNAY